MTTNHMHTNDTPSVSAVLLCLQQFGAKFSTLTLSYDSEHGDCDECGFHAQVANIS